VWPPVRNYQIAQETDAQNGARRRGCVKGLLECSNPIQTPSVDRYGLDNENPELPSNLKCKLKPSENRVYGEFEVCPLEPEREGPMQAACIESAKNLIAK
jgi:hypothetical protein